MKASWWFKKIPKLVEAVQWSGDFAPQEMELEEFLGDMRFSGNYYGTEEVDVGVLFLHTPEGDHICLPGDYLVRRGDVIYACNREEFEAKYQPAENSD